MSEERIQRVGPWPSDEAEQDQLTAQAIKRARAESPRNSSVREIPRLLSEYALAHLASVTEELVGATVGVAMGPVTTATPPRVRRVGEILTRLRAMGLRLPEVPKEPG